jgi:NAD(P)H-dependent FMN reductase
LKVEAWLKPILQEAAPDLTFTTVDVASFNLPVFDETVIPATVPAMAQWTKPHSAAWSEEIAKYDGYVLLANEYNFGISGSTKNAIDYLYHAWIGKPILIITYGIGGGTSASDQLKTVLTGMKTKPVETRPQLAFSGGAQGPDMRAALGGELGEDTKKEWEKEKKAEILKGLEELKNSLQEAQPAESN